MRIMDRQDQVLRGKTERQVEWRCDALKPGGPLTTRQPAEIYMSHVMRPIHVQKWPLGPTHHTHKMYILYKNDLITIYLQLYLITKMGLLPRILQNTR